MTKSKPEILAPAGSFESLIAAVRCGADAVYLGGRELNARRNAANFSDEELAQAVEYCHARGAKVYVALNTLVRDDEIKTAMKAIECACNIKADALILQDIGLASLAQKAAPDMPLHASTQMSVQTLDGIKLLGDLGFCRAVLPRELSKREIEIIAKDSPIELEMFVHGALCMCLSGQCLLSAVLGSRSGNRGLCAQPCRLPFTCENGTGHDLSLKDMSLVENLKELSDIGIASFKIEGRMKRPEYVAASVTACRSSLDSKDPKEYEHALESVFSRSGFTSGYYDSKLGRDMFGIRRKEDVTAAKDVLQPLAALYDGEKPLIKVDMKFTARDDSPAGLTVTAKDKTAKVVAENLPQKALNRSVTGEEISARLAKCGSTQFFAGNIETAIDDGLYISAAEINALRRQALEKLEEKISAKPDMPFYAPDLNIVRRQGKNRGFVIRVKNANQLPTDLSGVRRVVLPPDTPAEIILKLKALKIQPAAEVPVAIFGGAKRVYDSLIKAKQNGISLAAVGNLDGVAIAKKAGMSVCALSGINAFNSFSLDRLKFLGVTDVILSTELKLTQCSALGSTLPRGVFAYGRIPLMQVRNCPVKNGKTCTECKQTGSITDRMGINFPIECSAYGSTVLNSVPLILSDKQAQFNFADFSLLRFTTETKEQCETVLNNYRKGTSPESDFTRGLAFRGVE
ncbi:MAG: U32 family peptidase [Clostridia bacterium]|nr:U32 family peptidase [Clostridia bacterium]